MNHFNSWLQFPELEQQCIAHITASDSKSDIIKTAKHRLQTGDKVSAITILEMFKRDTWPDIYRWRV
jgi:hypothetical protein